MNEKFDLKLALLNADRFSLATYSICSKLTGGIEMTIDFNDYFETPIVQAKNPRIEIIYKKLRNMPDKTNMNYLGPYIVNASFSIELYLKCLLFVDLGRINRQDHTHNILYSFLNQNTKSIVNSGYTKLVKNNLFYQTPEVINHIKILDSEFSWDIDYVLRRNASAFKKWRYMHEKEATCFYAYGELRMAPREAILKSSPDLAFDKSVKHSL